MGRIKSKLVKRTANTLLKAENQFTYSFEDNKKVVDELVDMPSTKIRNIVAGYVTRLVKTKKEF